jgi:hypothetical protein
METSLIRLRPSLRRLILPTLILAVASFLLAFFADSLANDLMNVFYIAAATLVGLFWLLPMLSYLFGYLEFTNARLIYRFGFLGFRKRELEYSQLSSIDILRPKALGSKQISLLRVDGSELVITGYARTKLLAAEIERLARESV